jgi:hypothetical protein
MAKETKADILISIKPIHIANIASRAKNHEFRKYLIPNSVKRMWFYTSSPAQRLQYVAVISNGKKPGEIDKTEFHIGNAEFNAGDMGSSYAYEIIHLYELGQSLSLQELIGKKYLKGPPQKYQWVSEEMVDDIPLESLKMLF